MDLTEREARLIRELRAVDPDHPRRSERLQDAFQQWLDAYSCSDRPARRHGFIVDGQHYDTDEEYVSLAYIVSCVHYAWGRTVLWLRDGQRGGQEEDVSLQGPSNCIRHFSTVNTPRFLTVPPATMY